MREKDKIPKEEDLFQRVIDPNTGRDITGEYIDERLKELEIIADKLIQSALGESSRNQDKKQKIYEKFYWEIHNMLGMGSIGPATAVAGPLMERKKRRLAEILNISPKDIL